jgi:Tfp pilus assembly protein PilN
MTMIRINLIAEKKAGSTKAAKKVSTQQSEIQENLILIVSILLAFLLFMGMRHLIKSELVKKQAEEARLKKEWDEVKHWKDKKLEYEIQKELLNEKIQRISELKDRKQGPVKLMEDVANVLPESVWLQSIQQGYNNNLVQPSAKNRASLKPPSSNVGQPALVKVSGFANSTEAITNFANQILSMDSRYDRTDLNVIKRVGSGIQEYSFDIYFEVHDRPVPSAAGAGGAP